MVQPLVDFILSHRGLPFLVILTGILHGVSAYYFDAHSFFMLIWTAIATRAYVNYIGIDVVDKIFSGLSIITTRFADLVSDKVTQVVRDVSNELQEVGTNLTSGSGFSSIATEFNKHKIGLGACASTLAKCENVTDVLEEAVKVSSLLGLETSIVNSTIGRLTTLAGQAIEPMQQHGLEEMEKFIPLIASSAAMLDLEFGEVQIGKHMDKFARNTKSAQVISDHIRKVAEATGLIKSANWQILNDLNQMVNNLKEDHMWVVSTLALQGSLFVAPDSYKRVKKYEEAVKQASQTLRSINIPEIKNNQIVSECNHIIMKATDYLNQIEVIRRSIGIRPTPVGVCIYGESHIGKTEVVDQLVKRVKARLAQHPQFGNANDWSKWDANQREEFDSGYCGQEIVYMDDAFQDKQNKDHLMWYTYISSSCVGTIQGVAEHKGLPFRGLLCITTANELPTKSIAVSHIAALHNRFPLTYHFKKIGPFQKWDEGGKDFNHLEIRYGSMSEFVANTPQRRNAEGRFVPTDSNFPTCDLEGMVDQVVEKMIENMTFFNLKMQTSTTVPMEMHSIDDDDESIDDSYLDEVFGEIPDTPHSDHHNYRLEDIEEEDTVIEVEAIYERLPNTIVAGTANDATSSDRRRRNLKIDYLARKVAEDMNSALNRVDFDTIDDLGDWIELLVDANNKPVNRARFRCEGGLYDFLAALGAFKVKDTDQTEFRDRFFTQRIVRCEDNLGTSYLWGPAFCAGSVLYLVSPHLQAAINEAYLNPWRRKARLWKRNFLRLITDQRVARLMRINVVQIAGAHLLPASIAYNPTLLLAQWLRSSTALHYRHGIRPFWNTNFSVGGVVQNIIGAPQAPFYFIAKGFEYLEQISLRLSRHMMGLLLQLLEYFGIDVSGYWREIADLSILLLSEVVILGIASLLIYITYRLLKMLFKNKEEEPVEMHESKNEFGKGGRKQRQRKDKKPTLQVKTFQRRAFEEFICEEECDEEDLIVEVEEQEYAKIGICNDKKSFYGTKSLDFCLTLLGEDPEAKYCELVRNKNSHIVIKTEQAEDFLLEKSELVHLKRIPISFNREDGYGIEIRYNLVGSEEVVKEQHLAFLERLSEFKVGDWQGEIYCRLIDDIYHFKINLVGLSTTIQGMPRKFIQRELKNLSAIAEDIKGLKKMTSTTIEDVFTQHGFDESITLMNSLVGKHQVYMSIVDEGDVDSPECRRMTHGIGHLDMIIFNAHLYEEGEFVRFWRWENRKALRGYQVCQVEAIDTVRDIGFARILSKDKFKAHMMQKGVRAACTQMASMVDKFRSIEPYLCDEKTWRELTDEQSCLCYLPSSVAMAIGRVSIEGPKVRQVCKKTETLSMMTDFLQISQLNLSVSLARKGDCGGLVMSYRDRYQSKIIGFHCGGTAANWYACILRKEDLKPFTQHSADDEDSFMKLIVEGSPTDLPKGPECIFLGKYNFKTKPAGQKSLAHWKYSPFHEQFEEQLQPGPLDANDPRIEIEVPRNGNGEKSLLLIPNSVMCSELPPMEKDVLDICIEHLTDEMTNKIGHIKRTPEDMEDLLEVALNGDRENLFCTGTDTDKACGEPWNKLPECSKKKDFLNNQDGFISFREDTNGQRLKARVIKKLMAGKVGRRLASFSNSKLKDALIKLSAIKKAKTRVFHCIPVDKIICDAGLFGNFKEAYSQAFLQLNHAVGVNPHSLQWRAIFDHLNRHPNVFDMDFSNYDKHLHAELMHGAFAIIRKVIQNKSPDSWDEARKVLELESIETYVIDYDTVYMTFRGNKSGEYLTTVINCICNDILSYYTWIKTTGNYDLSEFRENVSGVCFGDDKIESVSDEYAEKYNYFTAKEVMSSIGHIITPGAKDEIEREFCPIDQAQFLKRGIVEWENQIVAPLLQRSIESPFVWTQIDTAEHVIWKNLVEQCMFEALLHGQEYYDEFRRKLGKCNDDGLRAAIAPLLSVTYKVGKHKYLQRYFSMNSHLCTSEN